MTQIRKLLLDLCPTGVPYLTLRKVAAIGTGSSNRNESTSEGIYPFYVRSKEIRRIDSFEFDETAIVIPGEGGVGDIFHFVEGKYALHQRAYRIAFHDERVLPKFAYYYLKVDFKVFIKAKAVDGTVTSIRKPMIEDFRIPVPPLVVQQEIVEILDSFTELEAELEARKIQYTEFRERIFDFSSTSNVRFEEIGAVCSTFSGAFVKKTKQDENFEYPVFNGGSTATGFYSEYNSPENSIAISARGSIGAVNWVPTKFWAGNSCHVVLAIDPRLNNRFLYHYLKFHEPSLYALRAVGSIPALNLKPLLKFMVPLPPIGIQEQVSSVLDKFEALINDITFGLPAEISARKKQYEYYCSKLLSFKDLEVV
jgi:type I restriction enzyme S subunit